MSRLMEKCMSPGWPLYFDNLSARGKVQCLKKVIFEYIETHTDEENQRLVNMLNAEASGGEK